MQRDLRRLLQNYLQALANAEINSDDEEEEELTPNQGVDDLKQHQETMKKQLKDNDITHIVNCHTGDYVNQQNRQNKRPNLMALLRRREMHAPASNTMSSQVQIAQRFLPYHSKGRIARFDSQVFCGQFSSDGTIFMSACQDQRIRLYSTDHIRYADGRSSSVMPFKTITARDVGWSVVDCHYSPDQQYLIYSSWCQSIHLCTIASDSKKHEALRLEPDTNRFCAFSVKFSPDSKEILAGGSDFSLYIYDLERRRRTLRIKGHEDDINTVSFAEENQGSAHIFYSGSDDSTCKIWDRRVLDNTGSSKPVGILLGHTDGITCVTSKGDGRYFATNGKDQTMKLWDIRRMKSEDDIDMARTRMRLRNNFDYRYQNCRFQHRVHENDMSIMTYVGHHVLQTLIRCYFSPAQSTGQRYLYTGSKDGCVYVFDVLTGEIVNRLAHHGNVVRDVSWHPYLPMMLSSSWDCTVNHWTYRKSDPAGTITSEKLEEEPDDDDDVMEDDGDQNWEDVSQDVDYDDEISD
ncbi:hypothetical protein AKO1_013680 [Acrasis kona]|uniref:Uncharacterized protein n=1 Tax=Acrasis kona TaxID=1008807 RepID=A0AAW2YUC8_9EUKA